MEPSTLKYEAIRTPLERPLLWLRHAFGALERRRHPELHELHEEPARIHAVLRRVLGPASNGIDVGCHYGSVLSELCRLAPRGHHAAFEPIPDKVRFLRRKFPEVDIHELALSDVPGHARFFVEPARSGFSALRHPEPAACTAIDVRCARLDDVWPQDLPVALLKLDIEGAELLALRGALTTLRRHKPVVLFECGPGGPRAFGYAPADLHAFLLHDARYAIYFLRDFLAERRAPVDAETFRAASSDYPFRAFNWLAAPQ